MYYNGWMWVRVYRSSWYCSNISYKFEIISELKVKQKTINLAYPPNNPKYTREVLTMSKNLQMHFSIELYFVFNFVTYRILIILFIYIILFIPYDPRLYLLHHSIICTLGYYLLYPNTKTFVKWAYSKLQHNIWWL